MVETKQLFEILVHQNADMLISYVRASMRDAIEVDDIFQDTMLTAWRKIDSYDRNRPFGPWLRGIAAKLILAHHRKAIRDHELCEPETLEYLSLKFDRLHGLPGDTFDEKLDALRECLGRLSGKYREPIVLRFQSELCLSAVAERMALSVETVKKRLFRAKAILLDCLQQKLIFVETS